MATSNENNSATSQTEYDMIAARDKARESMRTVIRLREAVLERAGAGLDNAQRLNLRVVMGAIWICSYLDGAVDELVEMDQLAEKDMARVSTMCRNIEHHIARASSAWGLLP